MVAYSFQRQFAPPIRTGRKSHTIRAPRKRHARPGEQLQLYTGMRTKQCQLIGRATCESVKPIRLTFARKPIKDMVDIEGERPICLSGLDEFAYSDGFDNWAALRSFWLRTHGAVHKFDGVIIRWKDFTPNDVTTKESVT